MSTRDGATYFAGRVWGISEHYNFGGTHPLIGHSVPNFKFEDGTRLGELMYDGRGILLDFDMNISLKTLASEYDLKYVSGNAKKKLGLSTLLVRPDGIIAWATDSNPNCSELQKVATRWFLIQNGLESR